MRAPLAVLCLLLAACGPARRDDDRDRDSEGTPDAGTTAPDAGTTQPDGGTTEPDGGTVTNGAPSATIATPAPGSGDVAVRVLLFDAESDPVTVTLEWDDQTGAGFRTATLRSNAAGLATAPDGVEHTLTWASATDLPNRRADVKLRLTPRDTRAGPPAQSFPFAVDNRRPNTVPSLTWGAVPSSIRGDVVLSVVVADAESDTLTVGVEFRVVPGPWTPVTLATPIGNVGGTPSGVQVPFTWSSAANVPGNSPTVQLRAQATDPQASGAWVETVTFAVQNGVSPPPGGPRITELSAGQQADWVEITNFGSNTVDLRGWAIRWGSDDQSGTAHIQRAPSDVGYLVGPGARVVVTDEQGSTANGTIYLSTGSSTQNIAWGSGYPGFVELVDPNGTAVDFVRWGGATNQPSVGTWAEPAVLHVPHDGASLVRQGSVDRDASTDFCAAPSTKGASDTLPCYAAPSASARVRFTEISPAAGSNGAYVEILNGGTAVDLRDWSVHTTSTNGIGLYVLRSTTAARLVVRSGAGTDSSGTQYAGTGASSFAFDATSFVSLRDPTGAPHDFVRWGLTAQPPPPLAWPAGSLPAPTATFPLARTTETFSTPAADVSPAKWCAASAPSPGTPSPGCRVPPVTTGVRISEVRAGSTFSGGSSVEIENAGSASVSLSDLQLVVDGTVSPLTGGVLNPGFRATFDGCSLLPTSCFSGFDLIGIFSGAGAIELQDSLGQPRDFVRFGGSTQQPSTGTGWSDTPAAIPAIPGGTSLGRLLGQRDTDTAADWCKQAPTLGAANGACQ